MVPDIWLFQTQLTRRLLAWSFFSMASGALMMLPGEPFWSGMGTQSLAWGTIDAAIAWFGGLSAQRVRSRSQTERPVAGQPEARRKLARLLWVNTGLDVLYVLGGVTLTRTLGASNPFWLGSGLAIIIQGGFLFFFDWLHARRLA